MTDLLQLHLQTLFILDAAGRILSTREPEQASPHPAFFLTRGVTRDRNPGLLAPGVAQESLPGVRAWAVSAAVPPAIADELARLAACEPPLDPANPHAAPLHAARYLELLGGTVQSGPAFTFPQELPEPGGEVVEMDDERLLQRHFKGWLPGEIRLGRAPVMAIVETQDVASVPETQDVASVPETQDVASVPETQDVASVHYPVSICFCARRGDEAAEAGLETAVEYRGRGFARRVTAAWARAIRNTGRIPMYSTDWSNTASLAVTRSLRLDMYAADWGIVAESGY